MFRGILCWYAFAVTLVKECVETPNASPSLRERTVSLNDHEFGVLITLDLWSNSSCTILQQYICTHAAVR